MFYCGIDIAKYRHEATVIDQAGAAVQESISFANSKEGCEKLLALFQRLDISKEGLLIGMEATGHYWLSVYGYLLEQGFEVKVINPIQSEAFRKMYIRQTKNARKDSFIIAQIMRFGQFSATNLAEEGIVAMRQLSRYRLALVDTCGDCKRRVIALLDQVFPEYDSLFSDTFGVTSKEVLSQYPTPEGMLTVSIRKLTTLLEKASHGRFGKEKAEQLKAAAASSFGVNFAKDAFAFQIRQLYRNPAVKTSRTQNCRIQDIHTVGSGHYDNAFIYPESIHLYKKLVQSLFPFIMTASHAGSTLSCNSIDLINKDDTRCVTLALFEKISYTGSTYTDKHFHKVRTGNGEKRNSRFSCHCLCQKCLTSSGRAYKQHAFRNPCTYFCIFLWRFQEIYHLYQIFLLLLQTCYLIKSNFLIIIRR